MGDTSRLLSRFIGWTYGSDARSTLRLVVEMRGEPCQRSIQTGVCHFVLFAGCMGCEEPPDPDHCVNNSSASIEGSRHRYVRSGGSMTRFMDVDWENTGFIPHQY